VRNREDTSPYGSAYTQNGLAVRKGVNSITPPVSSRWESGNVVDASERATDRKEYHNGQGESEVREWSGAVGGSGSGDHAEENNAGSSSE
jgi:hypothetical protein